MLAQSMIKYKMAANLTELVVEGAIQRRNRVTCMWGPHNVAPGWKRSASLVGYYRGIASRRGQRQ